MLFPGDASPRGQHAGAYDPSTSIGRKFLKLVLILVALLILSWPFIEPFLLETETRQLIAEDLPAGIGQLRVVYAADIHKGGLFNNSRVNALVSHINACSADIVLLGGDYANDSAGAIEFFQQLPRIHSRYGVYAVLGNHDRTMPESNLNTLRAAMQAAGVTPLVNAVNRVRIGVSDIYIAGVDDVNNGHADLRHVAGQVSSDDYVIFLCHSPAIIPDVQRPTDRDGKQGWFDLGLFGHTHGGQIALIGPLLLQDEIPKDYISGWLRQNRTDMLITRGVGTSGLPARLFCTPQIHLITINSPR